MPQQLNELMAALGGAGATGAQQIGPAAFVALMAASLASSFVISYLYLYFFTNRATGSQIHRAFPLLGISITAIFVCIQFSLPLSLGLLGALSIVRFRTPIKEPEEIGFIMLVIAAPSTHGPVDAAAVTAVLKKHVARPRLESVSQSGSETVVSFSFRGVSDSGLLALPGEIRDAVRDATFNVFFNRPGPL